MPRSINEYSHRVAICAARDYVVGTDIFVGRDIAFTAWAKIAEQRGQFYQNGFAVAEARNNYSHFIFTRIAPRFSVTGTAWIYEKRALTGDRWYKIMDVRDFKEEGTEWCFSCRLVQKSDEAIPPQPSTAGRDSLVSALPVGVRL